MVIHKILTFFLTTLNIHTRYTSSTSLTQLLALMVNGEQPLAHKKKFLLTTRVYVKCWISNAYKHFYAFFLYQYVLLFMSYVSFNFILVNSKYTKYDFLFNATLNIQHTRYTSSTREYIICALLYC